MTARWLSTRGAVFFSAFPALASAGCWASTPCARPCREPDPIAWGIGVLVWAVAAAATSTPETVVVQEQPAPVRVIPHAGQFDRAAARRALATVTYADCGQGGAETLVLYLPLPPAPETSPRSETDDSISM